MTSLSLTSAEPAVCRYHSALQCNDDVTTLIKKLVAQIDKFPESLSAPLPIPTSTAPRL